MDLKSEAHNCTHNFLNRKGMAPKEIEQKWLNTQQAADYLGISKSTLYHWVNDRKIEFHKLSMAGRLRFLKEDLDDHMVHWSDLRNGRSKWRA